MWRLMGGGCWGGVDPIPVPSSSTTSTGTCTALKTNTTDDGNGLNTGAVTGVSGGGGSHVTSWDINCGYTKLHIFNLHVYDCVLYIDADCLVVKGVIHLLYDIHPHSLHQH